MILTFEIRSLTLYMLSISTSNLSSICEAALKGDALSLKVNYL